MPERVGVVIPAAGKGSRMGIPQNKVFVELGTIPMIVHTLQAFVRCSWVTDIVVAVSESDREKIDSLLREFGMDRVHSVVGGSDRQESVYAGLQALPENTQWVFIHDGARPLVSQELLESALAAVRLHDAVGLGVRVKDTIKVVEEGRVVQTPAREKLWTVQTPQVFSYDLIKLAHERARDAKRRATDDLCLVEDMRVPVFMMEGSYRNVKITTREDLVLAESLMGLSRNPRVGMGYDVHQFVDGYRLVLGGVCIAYPKGLKGHSDADVAVHALMDALLGAAGLGDIGRMFPDTDPAYAGISSMLLLQQTVSTLACHGYRVCHADVTIVAQEPKLAPHIPAMQQNLAAVLQLGENAVNVKATTTEFLGFTGRGEGIAAYAVATLEPGHSHRS